MRVERPHVWVNTGDRSTQGKAGLLVEWRQTPFGEWEGHVILLNGGYHTPADTITICWIKAEFLRPAAP